MEGANSDRPWWGGETLFCNDDDGSILCGSLNVQRGADNSFLPAWLKEEVTKCVRRDRYCNDRFINTFLYLAPFLQPGQTDSSVFVFPYAIPNDQKQAKSYIEAVSMKAHAEKFQSLVMIVALPGHFLTVHVIPNKYEVNFYDSVADCRETSTKEIFGMTTKFVSTLLTAIFRHFFPNTGQGDRKARFFFTPFKKKSGQVDKDGKTGIAIINRTRLLNSQVSNLPACAEIACMELLAVLNHDLSGDPIWADKWNHCAYLLSKMIHWLSNKHQDVSWTLIDQLDGSKEILQQVMQSEFGSTWDSIFENVRQCHYGWNADELCPFCDNVLYGPNGTALLARGCCGKRCHANCLLNNLSDPGSSSEPTFVKLPPCTSGQCLAKENQCLAYLLINCHRSCEDFLWFDDLQNFKSKLQKWIDRCSKKELETQGKFAKWEYLDYKGQFKEDLPFEICHDKPGEKRNSGRSDDFQNKSKKRQTSSSSPSRRSKPGVFFPSVKKVDLEDLDVGYLHSLNVEVPDSFVDVEFSQLQFRVECTDGRERVLQVMNSVFEASYPPPSYKCLTCGSLFPDPSSFQFHVNSTFINGQCNQSRPGNRNYFSPFTFFIPGLVYAFLFKLSQDQHIVKPVFKLDHYKQTAKLPVLSPFEQGAGERSWQEWEAYNRYVSDEKQTFADFLESILKQFLNSMAKNVGDCKVFVVAPMLAYMPYVQPIWSHGSYNVGNIRCNQLMAQISHILKEIIDGKESAYWNHQAQQGHHHDSSAADPKVRFNDRPALFIYLSLFLFSHPDT